MNTDDREGELIRVTADLHEVALKPLTGSTAEELKRLARQIEKSDEGGAVRASGMTNDEEVAETRAWNAASAVGAVHDRRVETINDLIARMKEEIDRAGLHMGGPAIANLASEVLFLASSPLPDFD